MEMVVNVLEWLTESGVAPSSRCSDDLAQRCRMTHKHKCD